MRTSGLRGMYGKLTAGKQGVGQFDGETASPLIILAPLHPTYCTIHMSNPLDISEHMF